MTFFKKKLEGTNAKLDEVTHQRDEINISRERLRGEVSHLYDVIASLRHDLVIQKGQMQDVQRDLEIAHNDSNEKAAKIQKLNKQNRYFQLEANDLSKKIENLDGKILYMYIFRTFFIFLFYCFACNLRHIIGQIKSNIGFTRESTGKATSPIAT